MTLPTSLLARNNDADDTSARRSRDDDEITAAEVPIVLTNPSFAVYQYQNLEDLTSPDSSSSSRLHRKPPHLHHDVFTDVTHTSSIPDQGSPAGELTEGQYVSRTQVALPSESSNDTSIYFVPFLPQHLVHTILLQHFRNQHHIFPWIDQAELERDLQNERHRLFGQEEWTAAVVVIVGFTLIACPRVELGLDRESIAGLVKRCYMYGREHLAEMRKTFTVQRCE